eukprot:1156028-Pelagomonas_calceolata.AAC.3
MRSTTAEACPESGPMMYALQQASSGEGCHTSAANSVTPYFPEFCKSPNFFWLASYPSISREIKWFHCGSSMLHSRDWGCKLLTWSRLFLVDRWVVGHQHWHVPHAHVYWTALIHRGAAQTPSLMACQHSGQEGSLLAPALPARLEPALHKVWHLEAGHRRNRGSSRGPRARAQIGHVTHRHPQVLPVSLGNVSHDTMVHTISACFSSSQTKEANYDAGFTLLHLDKSAQLSECRCHSVCNPNENR